MCMSRVCRIGFVNSEICFPLIVFSSVPLLFPLSLPDSIKIWQNGIHPHHVAHKRYQSAKIFLTAWRRLVYCQEQGLLRCNFFRSCLCDRTSYRSRIIAECPLQTTLHQTYFFLYILFQSFNGSIVTKVLYTAPRIPDGIQPVTKKNVAHISLFSPELGIMEHIQSMVRILGSALTR